MKMKENLNTSFKKFEKIMDDLQVAFKFSVINMKLCGYCIDIFMQVSF